VHPIIGVATGARNLYQIRLVVETCPKQRFEIWEVTWGDGMKGYMVSFGVLISELWRYRYKVP